MFYDPIDGVTVNANLWQTALTTANFTIVQANSFLTINSANSVAASSGSILFSAKQFQRTTTFPIASRCLMKVPNRQITNGFIEVGFGSYATMTTSAIAAITDGIFFRFSASGLFGITVYNGTETSTSVLADPGSNVVSYMIVRKASTVDFYVGDILVASLATPSGNPSPASTSRLNWFARTYSTASVPTAAPRIDIGDVVINQVDMDREKQWPDIVGGMHRSAAESPTLYVQTANHANSTSPTSATLSNTAAGYTTLGGRYQFAAPAGAATDFALFAFQVPAGYQFYITGVTISSCNTGAAVATTATILDWSLGVGSSAVSLATTDAAATSGVAQTFSPRRVTIGTQGFIIGAAIGQSAADIDRKFVPPIICEANRYVHIIVQIATGTATASQIIRGDVQIQGYFE
jgi:hypothetical protein